MFWAFFYLVYFVQVGSLVAFQSNIQDLEHGDKWLGRQSQGRLLEVSLIQTLVVAIELRIMCDPIQSSIFLC
ncbi:hypothetical protein C1E47_00560 [Vibrio cholerae]|nr:hypothetical protein [Vibrio cholerae]RNE60804.1 hypothetical protein EEJ33_07355 [Vibrio cholerae]